MLEHSRGLSDIVFVGGFPHTPNVDAAHFIADEVMPLIWRDMPDARLVLVGYAPPPDVLALAGPRVVVTGHVPAVEPYLDKAQLVLAALRYGAGVKGKIVEALRLGVPVVTTSIGAEGIGIVPGKHALVGESAAELAAAALSLFREPTTLRRVVGCRRGSDSSADFHARRPGPSSTRSSKPLAVPSAARVCCSVRPMPAGSGRSSCAGTASLLPVRRLLRASC